MIHGPDSYDLLVERETRQIRPGTGRGPSGEASGSVGPYVLGPVLGQGGMGTVYDARHRSSGRRVALKVLARHLTRSAQAVRRFEAEAAALSRIDHPNVVRLIDFGHLPEGNLFLATELLEGRELGDVLASGPPLGPRQALPYVEQICAGLQAAHDRGVVHRDLKPNNIFVLSGAALQLKLLDFGVARLLDLSEAQRLTADGVMLGTPLYASPEQAMADPRLVTSRTDLYSVGVLLYLMLSGSLPFDQAELTVMLMRLVKDPPPPLLQRVPRLSADVARVVHWCMEKDPERRPPSAQVLARTFADAVHGMRDSGTVDREGPDQLATRIYHPAQHPALPFAATVCETPQIESVSFPVVTPLTPSVAPPQPLIVPRPCHARRRRWRHGLVLAGGVVSLAALSVLCALLVWWLLK